MKDHIHLRQKMRVQRQVLSIEQKTFAANAIFQSILQEKLIESYQHIAFYYPVNGECNPKLIIEHAWHLNKFCYLPVLPTTEKRILHFMPYHIETKLIENRYKIPEPKYDKEYEIQASQLDCVFVPLLAFDKIGNRLGMGAGFYDATFAFTLQKHHAIQLIGLAYEFQRVDSLVPESWDVPLNAIVTEKQIYWK